MRVFPGDAFTEAEIEKMLQDLIAAKLITLFTDDNGEPYLFVTNWFQDQKVEKPNKKYPQFADHSPTVRGAIADHSPTVRGAIADHSTPYSSSSSIVVGNGNGKEGSSSHAPATEIISLEENTTTTLSAIPGGAAAAAVKEFDDCHEQIRDYLRPDQWKRLSAIAAAQHYDPAQYGPVGEEVAAFVRHNLGDEKKRKRILQDPVAHFERHFPLWLKNAKQFNRKNAATATKSRLQPPDPKPPTLAAALAVVRARHGEFAAELSDDDVRVVLSNTNTLHQFAEAIKSRITKAINSANQYSRTGPTNMQQLV
jgi:hypothetical protein